DRSRLTQDKFDGQVARKREETGNKLRQPGARIEKRIGGPAGGVNEVCPIHCITRPLSYISGLAIYLTTIYGIDASCHISP
ncbi:MAG: hypothetical protein AB7Y74_05040, partial [Syntrophorhabdus sp.]